MSTDREVITDSGDAIKTRISDTIHSIGHFARTLVYCQMISEQPKQKR